MVLSVLFSAGAVPLSFNDQVYPTSTSVAAVVASPTLTSSNIPSSTNPEYVQFLEELVGELSGVFATWVHQNPPPSSPTSLTDMYHQRTNTCRTSNNTSGLLPDVIPNHYSSDKWNCSSSSLGEDLRVRRGLAPMRFRLDSVGSSVSSAPSSAVSTPTSAASFFSSSATSPMPFDLLPSPTTSSSTISFFADYPPLSSDISDHVNRTADFDSSFPVDATDAAITASPSVDASAADWRQVGRDLRGIADHFASTRRSQQNSATGCQQWSLLSAALCSPLASAGPLVSALAVYLWWKLVRRLTA